MFYSKLKPAFGGGSVYITKIWNEAKQKYTLPYEYWASPSDLENPKLRSYTNRK
jgi:hypothetical protein